MKQKLSLNSCSVPGFFSPSNPKLYADAVWEERILKKKKKRRKIMPTFSLALLLLPMVYYYCSVAVYKEM